MIVFTLKKHPNSWLQKLISSSIFTFKTFPQKLFHLSTIVKVSEVVWLCETSGEILGLTTKFLYFSSLSCDNKHFVWSPSQNTNSRNVCCFCMHEIVTLSTLFHKVNKSPISTIDTNTWKWVQKNQQILLLYLKVIQILLVQYWLEHMSQSKSSSLSQNQIPKLIKSWCTSKGHLNELVWGPV